MASSTFEVTFLTPSSCDSSMPSVVARPCIVDCCRRWPPPPDMGTDGWYDGWGADWAGRLMLMREVMSGGRRERRGRKQAGKNEERR
jgi:hypothetical protein